MTAGAPRCLNCDRALDGPFCAGCGQRVQDPDPSLRELAAEAWDAFVSVDGKFLSSMRVLLLRPGVLTSEYLRGHRARYLAPLRLYLVCSVAYFLVSSLVPDRQRSRTSVSLSMTDTLVLAERRRDASDSVERAVRRDSASRAILAKHGLAAGGAPLDVARRALADSLRAHEQVAQMTGVPDWLRRRLARGITHVMRDKKNFGNDYAEQFPRLLFVLMPVFGGLLALAYRSRRRRYPVHLIVALHLHAFVFGVLTIAKAAAVVGWAPLRLVLNVAALLWVAPYVPLALRQVYGGRLRFAMARSVLLAAEYALVGLAAFTLLAFSLLLLY